MQLESKRKSERERERTRESSIRTCKQGAYAQTSTVEIAHARNITHVSLCVSNAIGERNRAVLPPLPPFPTFT